MATASGISVKGRQQLLIGAPGELAYFVRVTGINQASPVVKRYGWVSVERLVSNSFFLQVEGQPLWTNGQYVIIPSAPVGMLLLNIVKSFGNLGEK